MSGGQIKAATQRARGKYTGYRASGKREEHKANRIVRNILKSRDPAKTAKKVIEAYPRGDVRSRVKRKLQERNIVVQ